MKYFTVTILMMSLVVGCSNGQSHAAPSEKKQIQPTQNKAETPVVKTVTLEKLLREPKTYAGQTVEVRGIFSSICCSGDFILKAGLDTIEVVVSEMPPKSKIGSKIRVVGIAFVKGNDVSIRAKEVKFE